MSDHTTPQPSPKLGAAALTWEGIVYMWERQESRSFHSDVRAVWTALIADAKTRDAEGVRKYGIHHQHDNGRDHAADAYQEALDGCCYWYAEWRKTGNPDAAALFADADTLAFKARAYLLKRDGK